MKEKLSIRVQKELPDFASEAEALDASSLEDRIVELAKGLEEVEKAKEADTALQEARENAKELNAPYLESKKVIRLKTSYLVQLLEEKGK